MRANRGVLSASFSLVALAASCGGRAVEDPQSETGSATDAAPATDACHNSVREELLGKACTWKDGAPGNVDCDPEHPYCVSSTGGETAFSLDFAPSRDATA